MDDNIVDLGGPPTYEVVDVTPELATEWLVQNTHNRNLRPRALRAYAEDMAAGAWHGENGDSIKRASDGTLLDGAHRLTAIVKSGATVRMLVVGNLPMQVQETLDTGAKRSFSDMLTLRGEHRTTLLSSVTRRALLWEKGLVDDRGQLQPTHAQMFDFLDKHPELRESAEVGDRARRALPISGSLCALAHWLFVAIDPDDAQAFFERMISGANLDVDDPVHVLRRSVIEGQTSRSRMTYMVLLAYVIKAWNAYRDGRRIGLLRFRPGGANPEQFPEPR